ncbi:unnamed protein product, partial [Penicillium nalgiovense]
MSFILGGLGARVDLLKQNFTLSMIGATTGVLFPIGLSYLLLYLGFGYAPPPLSLQLLYLFIAPSDIPILPFPSSLRILRTF